MHPRRRPGKEVTGVDGKQPENKTQRDGDDSSPRHPHTRHVLASARSEGHVPSCAVHYATIGEGHSIAGAAASTVVGYEVSKYEFEVMLQSGMIEYDDEELFDDSGYAKEEGTGRRRCSRSTTFAGVKADDLYDLKARHLPPVDG